MFYSTVTNDHGLPRDPFKSLAVPRPIGWVSSKGSAGNINLAPYSFFNAISDKPHYVVFGSLGLKDTVANIMETGEFVCSMATYTNRDTQNVTSVAVSRETNEFDVAGLEMAASEMVAPPRVANAPVSFECRLWKMFDLPPAVPGGAPGYTMVVGHIAGIYIDDAYIKDGYVDTSSMQPIARLGYMDYAVVSADSTFTIERPVVGPDGSVTIPASAGKA
ncbi:MAG: flavin reductase family protein [Pseudomonadota bacterium]